MKFIKSILILLLITNFIVIYISIESFFEVNNLFRREPELVKKMPSNISQAKIEFNTVVKERFPRGLSEIQLIQELSEQRFSPGWSYKNKNLAVFVSSNIACRSIWSIVWEANRIGSVTETEGKYTATCL